MRLSLRAGLHDEAILQGDGTETLSSAALQGHTTKPLYEEHQEFATFRMLGEQEAQPPCNQGRPSRLSGSREPPTDPGNHPHRLDAANHRHVKVTTPRPSQWANHCQRTMLELHY